MVVHLAAKAVVTGSNTSTSRNENKRVQQILVERVTTHLKHEKVLVDKIIA